MDYKAVRARLARLGPAIRACDEAQLKLYNTVMAVDKQNPRVTVAMRQAGILPLLSAFFDSFANMTSEISPLLTTLEQEVQANRQ